MLNYEICQIEQIWTYVYEIMFVTDRKQWTEKHTCRMHPFWPYSQWDVSLFNKLWASINTKGFWSADYQPDMIFHKHLLTYTCTHTYTKNTHAQVCRRAHTFHFKVRFIKAMTWIPVLSGGEYQIHVNIKQRTCSYLCGCEGEKGLPYIWCHF